MTLVEVVAGLVVLGVLVGSALAARGRYLRQAAHAQRVLDAAAAAETFLQSRWEQIAQLPRSSGGPIPGEQSLAWKTVSRPTTADGAALGDLEIVSLQIMESQAAPQDAPLIGVDLLLPRQTQGATTAPSGRRGR